MIFKRIVWFLLVFILSFPLLAPAAETLTITTYYPSPYGVYNEMRAKRIAIGDDYVDTANYTWEETDGDGGEVDYRADLIAEGNVGIGTVNPAAILDVNGTGPANSFALMRLARGGSEKVLWVRALDNTHIDLVSSGQTRLVTSGSETYNDSNAKIALTADTTGSVGIGTTAPALRLDVISQAGANGAALFRSSSYANVFSILPWASGITYLSSGTYYTPSGWIQANDTAYNQLFVMDTSNGARWYASSTGTGSWNLASAVLMWNNSGTWVGPSSRTLKENFTRLNSDDILNKIDKLNITRWNFKSEGKDITHIGPVAEDFYSIFKTGDAEEHLATIDSVGVSLAGVKALYNKLKSQERKIGDLRETVNSLKEEISRIKK